jgi:iron complex outermembrane receptor protein
LHGFYSTLNFNYIGKLPLNDGNTAIAEEYRIWRLKTGLKKQIKHKQCDFFILVDNIGNEKYSLGNDLNAFGSRYYNCAPGRTVAAGVSIDF